MNTQIHQPILGKVMGPVLLMSFYGQAGPSAFGALGLCALTFMGFTLLAYFLRKKISNRALQAVLVLTGACCIEPAARVGVHGPWWLLAALALFFPALENLCVPGRMRMLVVEGLVMFAAALCFFTVRAALLLTDARYFWENPAGHFGLLGLIALVIAVIENRSPRLGESHDT